MQTQNKQTSSNEKHHEPGAACQTCACRYKLVCCNNFIIMHKKEVAFHLDVNESFKYH